MFAASTDRLVIKLLNQIRDSEHFLGDTFNKNDLFIAYKQLKQKVLATCQFLRDDTVFWSAEIRHAYSYN